MMELTLNDVQTRGYLKDIFIELLQEKRSLFMEIFIEAIEEMGLAKAITEGLEGSNASEDEVFAILDEDGVFP